MKEREREVKRELGERRRNGESGDISVNKQFRKCPA